MEFMCSRCTSTLLVGSSRLEAALKAHRRNVSTVLKHPTYSRNHVRVFWIRGGGRNRKLKHDGLQRQCHARSSEACWPTTTLADVGTEKAAVKGHCSEFMLGKCLPVLQIFHISFYCASFYTIAVSILFSIIPKQPNITPTLPPIWGLH